MPERDWTIYIKDIHEALSRVIEYTQGMDMEKFFADRKTYDAVMRNLGIVGEAVKKVPDEIREMHTDIEWRNIAGFRDEVIHKYFGIKDKVVWNIIQIKTPVLKAQIESKFSDLL